MATPKRLWIVGASGALGGALREQLSREGHEFVWTYNTRKPTTEDPRAMFLDVRDVSSIEAAAARANEVLGSIDALVYLAAIATDTGRFLAMDDVTQESWDQLSAVNLRGAFFTTRAFARRCDRGGNVVFAGSIDGHKPVPGSIPYAATKGALEALVRSLAKELGPKNIRVNAVVPGILERGLSDLLPAHLVSDYLAHDALSRKGTLAEAASIFSFFATDNSYVTGRAIAVDGGL
ncbi:MAG: SDR family oxidoreductase [Myxococcales bacterium]|nr:SDR family oxidoreductase [Myxococcales bacterium]